MPPCVASPRSLAALTLALVALAGCEGGDGTSGTAGTDPVEAGDLCTNGGLDPDETGVDCGPTCGTSCVTFSFPLRGEQLVPSAASPSRGLCTGELSGTGTSLLLSCSHDVASPTAAHLHLGRAGTNGPIVFDLGAGSSTIAATITLTSTEAAQLLAGDWYLDLHSTGRPNGELRGQLSASAIRFPIVPRQMVPPITTSYGNGACSAYLGPARTNLQVLCTHNLTGRGAPTSALLHRGLPGASGPTIVELGTGASPIDRSVPLSPAHVAAFLDGELYLELRTPMFLSGELRGQLSQVVESIGAGDQEVPPTKSRDRLRCASFLAPAGERLAVSCGHTLAGAGAMELRSGGPGNTGPLLRAFEPGATSVTGTIALDAGLLVAYLGGDLYVTVRADTASAGLARAQLATSWSFPLDGAQHIPARATTHQGWCLAHLNPAETQLYFSCTHDIPANEVTRAHVHRCNAHCSGLIHTADFPVATSPFTAVVPLRANDAQLALDGLFYVHVHSTPFRGEGELRGQIAEVFDFPLEPSQVVPAVTSSVSGGCRAFVSTSELPTFALRCTHDVEAPSVAHLHRGPRGAGGAVMQTASPTGTSPIVFMTRLSGLAAGLVRGGGAYVDVHSAARPAGEVRGQIVHPPEQP